MSGQVFHLLIHLSSVTFVLYIYMDLKKKDFGMENKKPFTATNIKLCHKFA